MPRPRAAKYRRISDDREGRELGVHRQDEDLDQFADQLDLAVVADYCDNDIGASTRSRRPRPEYEQMLLDARAGKFDVIIAYTSGRLTRRPREHEDLIELAEQYGTAFRYIRSPSFDLNTANGRMIARVLAAKDANETEEMAERVSRAALQRAQRGEWHGGRVPPPGYRLVRGEDGKFAGLELDAQQSQLLRDAASRLLDGESLYSICNEWNEAGLVTRDGAHWRSSTLRRTLLKPAMIAKRTHRDAPGQLFDTGWPELLDRETWDRLCDLLGSNSRLSPPLDGSYGSKRALGGGVTVCGEIHPKTGKVCGMKLVSQRHRGVVRLICHKQATSGCGVVTVNYAALEKFVLDMVLERLDSEEFRAELKRERKTDDGRERELRDRLKELDRRRGRAQRAFLSEIMTEAEARAEVRAVDEEYGKIRESLARLVSGRLAEGVQSADDARKLWATADVARRRRFIQSLVTAVIVRRWPAGMATNLTARRGESAESLKSRNDELMREALRRRVRIEWRR